MKANIDILNEIKDRMKFQVEFYGCKNNPEYATLRNLFNAVTTEQEQVEFYNELRKIINK